MTEQPELPPELLERVAMTLWRTEAERAAPNVAKQRTPDAWLEVNPVDQERWRQLVRAAAPMLIAHGRELENAEVVPFLRVELGEDEAFDAIERKEHRSKP